MTFCKNNKTRFVLLKMVLVLISLVIPSIVALALGPITVPNDLYDPAKGAIITSEDGNVTVGVSKLYGGAIVYYKDNRISDSTVAKGNIIDYSNGGTLFTTALWTLPNNPQEQQYCYDNQKNQNGICNASQPFNNPTQGGYNGDGWAGNPNPTSVSSSNNKIHVTYRGVNYNYAYTPVKPMNQTNRNEWQTDMWGDIDISFHPLIKDVVIVDTKITYCRDMNDYCKNKNLVTQDNQLNTLFAAGKLHPTPAFRGPYERIAYMSPSGFKYFGPSDTPVGYDALDNNENWIATLQRSKDEGIGISIQKYQATLPDRFGYTSSSLTHIVGIQPELNKFENQGITRKNSVVVDGNTYSDVPRYEFQPGGWYKFRTYVATGTLMNLRDKLIRAPGAQGYVDSFSCNYIGGWSSDSFNSARRVKVRAYIHLYEENSQDVVKEITADTYRPDLTGVCSEGKCSYGITLSQGDLPPSFANKKLQMDVYGIASDGSEVKLGYSSLKSIIGPCQTAQCSLSSDCDDQDACTVDSCISGVCQHTNDTIACPASVPGDLDVDMDVDLQDLIILISDFGKTSEFNNPKSDINGDSIVDIYDVVYVASRFT